MSKRLHPNLVILDDPLLEVVETDRPQKNEATRELKFRACINDTTTICFKLLDLVEKPLTFSIRELLIPWLLAGNKPDEYIDKNDKNGVEIYTGDKFTLKGKYTKIVEYSEKRSGFCVVNVDDLKDREWRDIEQFPPAVWWDDFTRYIEVVGNIHEGEK